MNLEIAETLITCAKHTGEDFEMKLEFQPKIKRGRPADNHKVERTLDKLAKCGFYEIPVNNYKFVNVHNWYKNSDLFVILKNQQLNSGVVVSKKIGKKVLSFMEII